MASYDITDDTDLYERVRSETNYDDTADELPQSRLTTHVEQAKLELDLRTGSTKFYGDQGMAVALLALTCIKAKASVENYSVDAWDMMGQTINVSGAGDEDQVQFKRWGNLLETGLSNATSTDEGDMPTDIVSNSYVG